MVRNRDKPLHKDYILDDNLRSEALNKVHFHHDHILFLDQKDQPQQRQIF